jgi:hypothetical protein
MSEARTGASLPYASASSLGLSIRPEGLQAPRSPRHYALALLGPVVDIVLMRLI